LIRGAKANLPGVLTVLALLDLVLYEHERLY
jgi:hypothetical protein